MNAYCVYVTILDAFMCNFMLQVVNMELILNTIVGAVKPDL